MSIKRKMLFFFSMILVFFSGFYLCFHFFYQPLFLSDSYDQEILLRLTLVNSFEDSLFENEKKYEKTDGIIKSKLGRMLNSKLYTRQQQLPESIKKILPGGVVPLVSDEYYRLVIVVKIKDEERIYVVEKNKKPFRLKWRID
jgi:hypothetical protein